MTRLWQLCLVNAARFLPICCVFFLASATYAQQENPKSSANLPSCKIADLDASVQFANGPENYFTVAFNIHNISNHSCVLKEPLNTPQFYPNKAPGGKPFSICANCENRFPSGRYPVNQEIVLKPDEFMHQTVCWNTVPPDESVQCVQPNEIDNLPIRMTAPLLLKRICSEIEVSGYKPSTFPVSDAQVDNGLPRDQTQIFKLMSYRDTYYEQEQFPLYVSLAPPETEAPSNQKSCPVLYLKERSSDGLTRFDEIHPAAFGGCPSGIMGTSSGNWQLGFAIDSEARRMWAGIGEHTFEIFQPVASESDGPIQFYHSNVLRIKIADESTIQRKWGLKEKGLAVAITLDKDTFRLGEDVPLHVALENFDAAVPVYGPNPTNGALSAVVIEVRDSMGQPLPQGERFPINSVFLGGGSLRYQKGKVVPMEPTLNLIGWLPNHPGTYTVVVTWGPWDDTNNDSAVAVIRAAPKPYAVAQAVATIHIVDNSLPQ